jgi:alkylation response protein AidB-like acyl-CoA dehydrogenase
MDLSYTQKDEAFRREVRAWLRRSLPRRARNGLAAAFGSPERLRAAKAWQHKLFDAGYVAMGWPRAHGGRDASIMEQTLLDEELVRARAPGLIGLMGIRMVGPTLIQFGTEAQRQRHLRRILTGEEIWCQGYSEPGAGSDLASLKTRAEIVGDDFVINGQKVWTSGAQFADWMFCLVRTDPAAPKHQGISYVLIDMHSPGVTVRPLIQMTGDAGFNEVFFEDVRVPRAHLVGELHQGWRVANATLVHERNMLGASTRTQQLFLGLRRLARAVERDGRPASEHPIIRHRLAALLVRVEAMKYHAYRQLTDALHGRHPGIAASVNKLVNTELNHDIAAFAVEIMGSYGPLARNAPRAHARGVWPYEFMFTLGMIIGGGTSQIQKNIISERGLGMPRH